VYEISQESLNGFSSNSQGRRVWSLAQTSLSVKVKDQGHRGQKTGFSEDIFIDNALHAMQQQTGPFRRCREVMGVISAACVYVW